VAKIVSFASGKGGVGKSTTVSNLSLLLARSGMNVVAIDLDVGGADLHVLFGELSPTNTLSDFLARNVEELSAVAQPVSWCPRLRLIAGTGETLRNTNPAASSKRRLERHLHKLQADVILIDIGAGTNYHSLDFFLWGDIQVVISTPDPTAVLDLYKFIKLAATRRVLMELGTRDPAGELFFGEDFRSLEQLLAAAEADGPETERRARAALRGFAPALLLNNTSGDRASLSRITHVIKRFLGSDAVVLGEVPSDPAIVSSVRRFLPVVEREPNAPSARAFQHVERELRGLLARVPHHDPEPSLPPGPKER
jgi:flagellar biosynthesis protein FlhG